jgi:hypothetical protein
MRTTRAFLSGIVVALMAASVLIWVGDRVRYERVWLQRARSLVFSDPSPRDRYYRTLDFAEDIERRGRKLSEEERRVFLRRELDRVGPDYRLGVIESLESAMHIKAEGLTRIFHRGDGF